MGNRFARWALVVCLPLTALVGCGDQEGTAGERVPGLVQELDRIDDSIAAGRYSRARAALDALVETTSRAREAGDLDAAQAGEIAGAAARLRAALPAVQPGSPEAEPTEEPSASPTPREDDEEQQGHEHDKEHDKEHGKEHGKGHGKGHKDD